MSNDVSYFAGGLGLEGGKPVARPLTADEKAVVTAVMDTLSAIDPGCAAAVMEGRIVLAEEAIRATLPEDQRDSFSIDHQPSDVISGLPYMESIDELCSPEALKRMNDHQNGVS
jgi:hypothetical protein